LPANVPSDSHYDIMYSTGGGLFSGTDVGRQATGTFTNWAFVADRWVVHTALSLIHWSLSFHVADALTAPAAKLAATYQHSVVDQIGLIGVCLFAAAAWSAWHIFRSRLSKGAGEFGVSLIILLITTATWAAPATFLLGPGGLLGHTRDVATTLGQVTAGVGGTPAPPPGCPGGPDGPPAPGTDCLAPAGTGGGADYTAPLLGSLHHAFVEVPYQLLNWGEQLDIPGHQSPCLATETKIVASGPHSTSDDPRNMMTSAGCPDLAKFNAAPSADRLVGAALSFLGSLIVMVLAIVIAFALMLAELTCVGLVVAFPLVAAVALVPGPGRELLWRWITHAIGALLALIATVVCLSLMLVGVDGVLSAVAGQALLVIFALLDALVVATLIFHRRLRKGLHRAAENFGRRLENATVGGAGPTRWLKPAAAGFGAAELLDVHRQLRHRAHQGTNAARQTTKVAKRVGAVTKTAAVAVATSGASAAASMPKVAKAAKAARLARAAARTARAGGNEAG
jgi:hypothetical protein